MTRKRTVLFVVLAASYYFGVCVIHAHQKSKHVPNTSAELDSLIINVSAAMPEVSADLLIRIVESKLVTKRQKKIELLEEAFRRSSEVQQRARLRLWTGAVDSRGGYLSAAFDQQLDSLSLKCRVIKAMLRLDVERARKLFLEIPKIRLPQLSCDQTLAYDVTEFYQTMSEIADKSFSATEIQQGERLRFIQTFLETVESPAQVSPAMSLMLNSSLSGVDLSVLTRNFSSILGKVTVDPRSFMASTLHGNLITNVEQLLHRLKNAGLPTSEFVGSFHSYLLNQMKSVQCSDVMNSQSQIKQLWTNIDRFNKWLSEPIEVENIKASRIEHIDEGEQFWTTAESSRLLMKTKALRFGDGTEPLPTQARTSNDWQQQMELLLGEIDRWDGSSERIPLTYFHEKSNLYSSLFELAPTNAGRVRVLLSYAGYLRNADAKDQSHIEWLLHLRGLLKKMQKLDAPDRVRVFDVFRNSGNQAIQLYADFDLLSNRTSQ